MKILQIFPVYQPNYQPDGIGDYTKMLVSHLRDLGEEVYVASDAGYRGSDDKVFKIHSKKWGWNEIWKIMKIARENKIDILHMQYTPVTYGFGVIFKFLPFFTRLFCPKARFVTTFHTLVGGRWISKINAFLLSFFSSAVISTNEELSILFRKWMPVLSYKLSQIPIGSNIISFKADRLEERNNIISAYKLSEDAFLMVNFGFPNPWKGIEDLIEALDILAIKGPYYAVMIYSIRQEYKAYHEELLEKIKDKGLKDRVLWINGLSHEKVSRLIQACDVFVAPYKDGASIRRGTLMAAIEHGMPVITTKPRSEFSCFVDGKNCLLVDPGDPEGIAKAAQDIRGDDVLKENISDSISKMRSEFSWTKIAEKTLSLYKKLI